MSISMCHKNQAKLCFVLISLQLCDLLVVFFYIKWIYEVFMWHQNNDEVRSVRGGGREGKWWGFTKYCNLRGSYQDCLVLCRLFIVFDKAVTEITRLNIFNNRNILIECFIFYLSSFSFQTDFPNISGYGIWEK